jgi:predicted TIM-barrel fold metal-dependent hydrolase
MGAFDTMLGLPPDRDTWQAGFGNLIRDAGSKDLRQPAGYMFKDLPEVDTTLTYEQFLLGQMDRWGVVQGLVPVTLADGDLGHELTTKHPDRLFGSFMVDPNDGMDTIRSLRRAVAERGVRAAGCFNCGLNPQVAIDDKKMYPIYATCVELDIPIFLNAGVPGPRMPMWPQHVERLDVVCYDFPDLVIVTRHGCEPWTALAVKLMLKWPGLHYSTSAFAPKHYPRDILEYANTRGADKVLYAGYFPYGLSLERIATEMRDLPLRDHVWPKFLHENAARILKVA